MTFDRSQVPEPVFDARPDLIDLYWVAWEQAWDHVVTLEGAPRSPYMDEGFAADTIWIWDTCFMAHFCKYAPHVFPGVESFDNFYRPMYDGVPSPLKIHHPDNPPLFAWSELEYVRHTGDLSRVEWLIRDRRYLQHHFEFFDHTPVGTRLPATTIPTTIARTPRGYLWEGVQSGMDNTPRAPIQGEHGTSGAILWFDAAAQQALSARCIAALAELIGDDRTATHFRIRHEELAELVTSFWDREDGMFYDRFAEPPHEFHRVRTPAAYWPLLAGACDAGQAKDLACALSDPDCFGGVVPWPSVARSDPEFRRDGMYWRGGVWVPAAYMSARALAENGYEDLAREATTTFLDHMARTYREYAPHTIWEAYSPTRPAPSTAKDDETIVRPDFCGWSALAPISMFLEHVVGVQVNAVERIVTWRRPTGRAGVRRLRCGPLTVSVLADGDQVQVEADGPMTLILDGRAVPLTAGHHVL